MTSNGLCDPSGSSQLHTQSGTSSSQSRTPERTLGSSSSCPDLERHNGRLSSIFSSISGMAEATTKIPQTASAYSADTCTPFGPGRTTLKTLTQIGDHHSHPRLAGYLTRSQSDSDQPCTRADLENPSSRALQPVE
jgi:hypothetical protein